MQFASLVHIKKIKSGCVEKLILIFHVITFYVKQWIVNYDNQKNLVSVNMIQVMKSMHFYIFPYVNRGPRSDC